jgi:hypothetical protein
MGYHYQNRLESISNLKSDIGKEDNHIPGEERVFLLVSYSEPQEQKPAILVGYPVYISNRVRVYGIASCQISHTVSKGSLVISDKRRARHAAVSHSTKYWLNKTVCFFEGPLSHNILTTLRWYRFHLENSHLHHAGISDDRK